MRGIEQGHVEGKFGAFIGLFRGIFNGVCQLLRLLSRVGKGSKPEGEAFGSLELPMKLFMNL
jgi:hypothetical protein